MGKVEQIEHEIKTLTPKEISELRQWFIDFDANVWDQQIEKDAQSGRLDAAAEEALRAFESGKAIVI